MYKRRVVRPSLDDRIEALNDILSDMRSIMRSAQFIGMTSMYEQVDDMMTDVKDVLEPLEEMQMEQWEREAAEQLNEYYHSVI